MSVGGGNLDGDRGGGMIDSGASEKMVGFSAGRFLLD